jgi:hypothetical protein
MQMLGRYYVQYYNYCYQRTSTLWEGRYKATLIDCEAYLLTCMRYIKLNPERAGMVTSIQLTIPSQVIITMPWDNPMIWLCLIPNTYSGPRNPDNSLSYALS